jgi:hypothetical protein
LRVGLQAVKTLEDSGVVSGLRRRNQAAETPRLSKALRAGLAKAFRADFDAVAAGVIVSGRIGSSA